MLTPIHSIITSKRTELWLLLYRLTNYYYYKRLYTNVQFALFHNAATEVRLAPPFPFSIVAPLEFRR